MSTAANSIAFVSSDTADAKAALESLSARYGQVSGRGGRGRGRLGGDGFLLQTLRDTMGTGKKVYGMNRGTIGFLMNEYRSGGLTERIAAAVAETIRPLEMLAVTSEGETVSALAINEVALWRQSYQTAKIRITRRRAGTARRTELRRRDDRDAGRLDRLQSFRARADPAARRAAAGAHAGQPVPPAPLARRIALQQGDRALRHSGAGKAAGERRRRPHGGQGGDLGNGAGIADGNGDLAV